MEDTPMMSRRSVPSIRTAGSLSMEGDRQMTRQERLLRLAQLRGDRAAELIVRGSTPADKMRRFVDSVFAPTSDHPEEWTEAELCAAWGDR